MGSIDSNEHLLCLLPFPEPTAVTDLIRQEHPHLKITYLQYVATVEWSKSEALPEETWKDVTILFTLSKLPVDLATAPRLKLVHLFSTGTDHIWNTIVYKDSNIPITTAAGVPAPAMAEWVIMSILIASRKYNVMREWQLAHAWNDDNGGKQFFAKLSLTVGKKIGILGYGSVGRQVANIAKSLGMEIVACTANPRTSDESKRYQGYNIPNTGDPDGKVPIQWFDAKTQEALHNFLAQDLDYLVISLPLTGNTKRLLGEEEFEILSKRNTFVINVSRAEVIDQDCLIKALHEYENDAVAIPGQGRKGISGAAIDVADPEPLPKDHPLWDAPNCIITPHISFITREYGAHAFQILRTNLTRLGKGGRLLNQIDRDSGYSSAIVKP